MTRLSSRIPGFHRLTIAQRLEAVQSFSSQDLAPLLKGDEGAITLAEQMIENAVGVFGLPLGFAPNFRIDGHDHILPMAVEEPSVLAAAGYGALLLRSGDGIITEATDPVMVGQIQLLELPSVELAQQVIEDAAEELVARANVSLARLVARGGGARGIRTRVLHHDLVGPMLVVELLIDVCDAMGANLINSTVEHLAPRCEELTGGRAALKILSNLADQRLVRAEGRVPLSALDHKRMGWPGELVAERIVEASAFAEADPWRACTHNKGVMNGIDAFLIATGQDWRAVEAGAHAWAARNGRYEPMAVWRIEGEFLVGRLEVPMQVGTVGGVLGRHPVVDSILSVVGVKRSMELGRLAASVGLAQNLSAIRALATEGIQRGHMALHARNVAAAAGARPDEVEQVVAEMRRRKQINRPSAREIVAQLRADGLPAPLAETVPIDTKADPRRAAAG